MLRKTHVGDIRLELAVIKISLALLMTVTAGCTIGAIMNGAL
jgi:hypothetical protein